MLYKVTAKQNLSYSAFKLEKGMSVEVSIQPRMNWSSQEWIQKIQSAFLSKYNVNIPTNFIYQTYMDVQQLG